MRSGDEVWIVADKDNNDESDLTDVNSKCMRKGYHLAVSNPCFEYWLLLHFEEGNDLSGIPECRKRLKRHLPHYEKSHIEINKIEPKIPDAIRRAEVKDRPPCTDWPRSNGSTVYKLVEKLMNS
jgi:hypothetical protein